MSMRNTGIRQWCSRCGIPIGRDGNDSLFVEDRDGEVRLLCVACWNAAMSEGCHREFDKFYGRQHDQEKDMVETETKKDEAPEDKTEMHKRIGFVIMLLIIPTLFWVWVEFIKLCVWLGRYTWP